eukprot:798829-Rhodomonas_salina.1
MRNTTSEDSKQAKEQQQAYRVIFSHCDSDVGARDVDADDLFLKVVRRDCDAVDPHDLVSPVQLMRNEGGPANNHAINHKA